MTALLDANGSLLRVFQKIERANAKPPVESIERPFMTGTERRGRECRGSEGGEVESNTANIPDTVQGSFPHAIAQSAIADANRPFSLSTIETRTLSVP